jgi:rRNA-processing protein FCF1
MVLFDTSFLNLAFDNQWNPPIDPETGLKLEKTKERIDYLLSSLSKAKQRVLIPTPVLAEYLVRGGEDKVKRLEIFTSSKVYQVASFDSRSAVECAEIEDGDSRNGKKLSETESRAKVKFDRQIIAIAKVNRVTTIYTGDIGLAARAKENGLKVVMTWEVPLPPEDSQLSFSYVE